MLSCTMQTKAAPACCAGTAEMLGRVHRPFGELRAVTSIGATCLLAEDQHEDDDQGEESQGFDEHESEKHGRANGVGCSGISRHAFAGGRSDFRLCVAATCRG